MLNFSPTHVRFIYLERCKEPGFSINLKKPTEARIRNACINTYQKKAGFNDKSILRNFLNVSEDQDLALALKRNTGKFRPVVNFLKNETDEPRDETIELIAWLIDFNFESTDKTHGDDIIEELEKEKVDQEKEDKKNPLKGKKPIFKEKEAIAVLVTIVLAITSGLASLLFNNQKSTTPILNFTGQEKYMFWMGDHYQPTNKSQIKGVNIVPFNAKLVTHFKKITDPDTLTTRSIGKVWYVKINNKHEFYTATGSHPGDTLKRLKPLTKYIVERYTLGNKNLLIFINSIFCFNLIGCVYSTYILYKKRQKMRLIPEI